MSNSHLDSISSLLELGKSYALFHAHGELEAAIVDAIPALVERVRELEAALDAANNQFICLECGTHAKVDEDGCCAGCGRDCLIIADGTLHNAHAVIDGMREIGGEK